MLRVGGGWRLEAGDSDVLGGGEGRGFAVVACLIPLATAWDAKQNLPLASSLAPEG